MKDAALALFDSGSVRTASASAASIGGMVANNAAGMCCTVDQNTFATLRHMRLILADGTLLDTEDPASVAAFRSSHAHVLDKLGELRQRVMADPALAARIRRKYSIKNTTGYAVNALDRIDDPLDILGPIFSGRVRGHSRPSQFRGPGNPAHPAPAGHVAHDLSGPGRGGLRIMALRRAPVQAAELDRTAIRAVENLPAAPPLLRELAHGLRRAQGKPAPLTSKPWPATPKPFSRPWMASTRSFRPNSARTRPNANDCGPCGAACSRP